MDPKSNNLKENGSQNLPRNVSDDNGVMQNAFMLAPDKIAANMRVLRPDGQVITWGDRSNSAYGSSSYKSLPDRSIINGTALTVSSGIYNAAVITTDGEVKTWGGISDLHLPAGSDGQDFPITGYASGTSGYINKYPTAFQDLQVGYEYGVIVPSDGKPIYEPDSTVAAGVKGVNGQMGFPMSVDISEYLQVSYDNGSLWSVGNTTWDDNNNALDQRIISGQTIVNGQTQNVKLTAPGLGQGGSMGADGKMIDPWTKGLPNMVSVGTGGEDGKHINNVFTASNSTSAKNRHSVAVKTDGSVWSYGQNGSGRLGDSTSTSSAVPVRVGASYFVLEEYVISIAEGETYQMTIDPKISAFNVFNSVEEAVDRPLTWAMWDDETTAKDRELNGKVSINDFAKVDYSSNDKRPTVTGLKRGVTYIIMSSAEDAMSVTSIRVEVRPAKDDGANNGIQVIGQDGGVYQGIYDKTPDEDRVSVAYPQVVSGSSFNVALAGDGTVWTWGSNEYGELGNGTVYGTASYPVQVMQKDGQGLNNVRKVAATGNFAYALKNDGTVWAWGRNDAGQLGQGKDAPTRITLATQVKAGQQYHSSFREDPDETKKLYLQEIVDIAVGGADDAHGYALFIQSVYTNRRYDDADPTLILDYNVLSNNVFGVGDNSNKQLKSDAKKTKYEEPVIVDRINDVAATVFASDSATAYYLQANGMVKGTGLNTSSEFGCGVGAEKENEGSAMLEHRALTVGAGHNYAMAVVYLSEKTRIGDTAETSIKINQDVTGQLWGWGANTNAANAMLFGDDRPEKVDEPVRITELSGATEMRRFADLSGGRTMTMTDSFGYMATFGDNSKGQQAGATINTGYLLVDPNTSHSVFQSTSSSGGRHSAFVDQYGYVYAMGEATLEQLGLQDYMNYQGLDNQVGGGIFVIEGKTNEASIQEGSTYDLADNYTVSSGFNLFNQAPRVWNLKEAANNGFMVNYRVLNGDGLITLDPNTGVITSLDNVKGNVIILVTVTDANGRSRTVEFRLSVMQPFVYHNEKLPNGDPRPSEAIAYAQTAVGDDYVLALKANGELYSWGRNNYGVLGLGPAGVNGFETKPQRVYVTSPDVKCYVDDQGRLVGLTGEETSDKKFALLNTNGGFIEIWEDREVDDGTGNGTTVTMPGPWLEYVDSKKVTTHYEGAKIVKIAAGSDFAMAVDDKGRVYTWGRNNYGQLGNSSYLQSSSYTSWPTLVSTLGALDTDRELGGMDNVKIVDVFTGSIAKDAKQPPESYAAALSATGDLFVWGSASVMSSLFADASVYAKNQDEMLCIPRPVYVEMAGINDVMGGTVKQGDRELYIYTEQGLPLYLSGTGAMGTGMRQTSFIDEQGANIDGRIVELFGATNGSYLIREDGSVYVNASNNEIFFTRDLSLSGKTWQISGGDTVMALTREGEKGLLTMGVNNAGEQGTGYGTEGVGLNNGSTTSFDHRVKAGEAYETDTSMTSVEDTLKTVVWADSDRGYNQDTRVEGYYRDQNGLSAAIVGSGQVYAWGDNTYGQLGDITIGPDPLDEYDRSFKALPNEVYSEYLSVKLKYLSGEPSEEKDKVKLVNNRMTVMLPAPSVGVDYQFQLETQINWFNVYSDGPEGEHTFYYYTTNPEAVTVGRTNGILTLEDVGSAIIAIYEPEYQLYTFVEVEVVPYSSSYPVGLGELVTPELGAGNEFSVALDTTGTVWAWGSNKYNQVSQVDNTGAMDLQKVQATGGLGVMSDIVDIAVGDNFALAARQNGTVWAWGREERGSLGQNHGENFVGIQSVPWPVTGANGVGTLGDTNTGKIVKVYAHGNSAAAITEDGSVYTWGENANHHLGDKRYIEDEDVFTRPVKVPGIDNAMEIYFNGRNMYILTADGLIYSTGVTEGGLTSHKYPANSAEHPLKPVAYYPQPVLNSLKAEESNKLDYFRGVVMGAIGSAQAVFMTMEYDENTLVGIDTASVDPYRYEPGLTKHIYMMGNDGGRGLLANMTSEEEGLSLYVPHEADELPFYRPTEYTYFSDKEYQRLLQVAAMANDAISSNGTSTAIDNAEAEKLKAAETASLIAQETLDAYEEAGVAHKLYTLVTDERVKAEYENRGFRETYGEITAITDPSALSWEARILYLTYQKIQSSAAVDNSYTNAEQAYEDCLNVPVPGGLSANAYRELYQDNLAAQSVAKDEVYTAERAFAAAERNYLALSVSSAFNDLIQNCKSELDTAYANGDDTTVIQGILDNARNNMGASLYDDITADAKNVAMTYLETYATRTGKQTDLVRIQNAMVEAEAGYNRALSQDSIQAQLMMWERESKKAEKLRIAAARAYSAMLSANETKTKAEKCLNDLRNLRNELTNAYTSGLEGYQQLMIVKDSVEGAAPVHNTQDVIALIKPMVDGLIEKAAFINDWIKDEKFEDQSLPLNVASVYAGDTYGAVVTEKGNVFMWGQNTNPNAAILGDRNDSDGEVRLTPSPVYASSTGKGYLEGIVRLSPTPANGDGQENIKHILAHANTGLVYGWGGNKTKQLCDGTDVPASAPVVVGAVPLEFEKDSRQVRLNPDNPTRTLYIAAQNNLMMVYGDSAEINRGFSWKTLDPSIATVPNNWTSPRQADVRYVREGETKVVVTNRYTGQSAFARIIVTDGVTYPQLVLGEYNSFALKKNGTVWAWGDNTFRVSDEVDPLTGRMKVDASRGDETTGKLGTGSKQELLTAPVQLTRWLKADGQTAWTNKKTGLPYPNVLRISAGDNFTVAVDEDGNVWGWGDNSKGQLNADPKDRHSSEFPIMLMDNTEYGRFIAVATGAEHVIAVTENGVVYSWGDNTYGQLSRRGETSTYVDGENKPLNCYPAGKMMGFTSTPLNNVMDVAATASSSAVLLTNGTVWTIGSNAHGELGAGLPCQIPDPEDDDRLIDNKSENWVRVEKSARAVDALGNEVPSEEIVNVNRILGRGYNFAIITEAKTAYTWGRNTYTDWNGVEEISGQLGTSMWYYDETDDTPTQHPEAIRPVQVMDVSGGVLQKVIDVSIGGGINQSVQMVATTMDVVYEVVNDVPTAVDWSFENYAWGVNDQYKAGTTQEYLNGKLQTYSYATPIALVDLIREDISEDEDVKFQATSAGGRHTGVFDTNGIVYMWGNNQYGQIGNFELLPNEASPDYTAIVKPSKVDEERIVIYEVGKDAGNRRTETENSFYTMSLDETKDMKEKTIMAKYLYSFSVDKEVDEAKTADLVYTVQDNALLDLGNLRPDNTRIRTYKFSMDKGPLQRTVQYEDVKMKVTDSQLDKLYGQTRVLAQYIPEHESDANAVAAKVGFGMVDVLGRKVLFSKDSNYPTDGATVYEIDEDTKTYAYVIGEDTVVYKVGNDTSVYQTFKTLPQVEAGDSFTLGLKIDGTVWAWGSNENGRLGINNLNELSLAPTQVTFKSSEYPELFGTGVYITKIAAGSAHALALDSNGRVWAWGDNSKGQLGVQSTSNNVRRPMPVNLIEDPNDPGKPMEITDSTRVVAIYAGQYSSYLITKNGKVYAMGQDEAFMTGSGYGSKPTELSLLAHTVEIDGRYALKSGATVWLLPKNANSPDITRAKWLYNKEDPTLVERIIDIAAYDNVNRGHLLAVSAEGKLWASGQNDFGQLGRDTGRGDGVTGDESLLPTVKSSGGAQMSGVMNITAGNGFSAAVVKETSTREIEPNVTEDYVHYDLYTWGRNTKGQTGLNQQGSIVEWPTRVNEANNIDDTQRDWDTLELSGGADHLITGRRNGSMWTAGENNYGQLGDMSRQDSRILVLVGQQDVTVSPTKMTVRVGGTLYLEEDTYPGTDTYNPYKIRISLGSGINLLLLTIEGTSGLDLCESENESIFTVDQSTGKWLLHGVSRGTAFLKVKIGNETVRIPVTVEDDTPDVATPAIAVGKDHVLALKFNGTLWSWGNNDHGQLGREDLDEIGRVKYTDENGVDISDPNDPANFDPVMKIAAADGVSFFVTKSGRAYAFGNNGFNRLGVGVLSEQDARVPTQMVDADGNKITTAEDVSAGSTYTYVLSVDRNDGHSVIYGSGEENRNGAALPMTVDGVSNAVALSGRYMRTSVGTVWMIEKNGNTAEPVLGFTDSLGDTEKDIVKIAASEGHLLALDEDGKVWSLGSNSSGQLGNGTEADRSDVPVRVLRDYDGVDHNNDSNYLSYVVDIAAGQDTSYALVDTIEVDDQGQPVLDDQDQPVRKKYVMSWGSNAKGQLGSISQTETGMVNQPYAISDSYNREFESIHAGYQDLFAVQPDGKVWAIGNNASGQFANGNTLDSRSYVLVGETDITVSLAKSHNGGELGDYVDAAGAGEFDRNTYKHAKDTIIALESELADARTAREAADQELTAATLAVTAALEAYQADPANADLKAALDAAKAVQKEKTVTATNAKAREEKLEQTLSSTGLYVLVNGTYVPYNKNDPTHADPEKRYDLEISGEGYVPAATPGAGQYNFNDTAVRTAPAGTLYLPNNSVYYVDADMSAFSLRSVDNVPFNGNFVYGSNRPLNTTTGIMDVSRLNNDLTVAGTVGRVTTAEAGTVSLWVYEQMTGKRHYVPVDVVRVEELNENYEKWDEGTDPDLIPKVDPFNVGVKNDYYLPTAVTAKVVTGESHVLALRADNSIWAYGLNTDGQMGIGENNGNPYVNGKHSTSEPILGADDPVEVKTYETAFEDLKVIRGSQTTGKVAFVDLAAGKDHSLAVDEHGNIWATGSNASGQLGVDTKETSINGFIKVYDASDSTNGHEKIVAVSAGDGFSLALDVTGRVWVWGRNDRGQLGLGHTDPVKEPTMMSLKAVTAVSAGYDHSLFLTSKGGVYVAGDNTDGWLLMNEPSDTISKPTYLNVSGGNADSMISISAGYRHNLATDYAKTVYAWGSNESGQLGLPEDVLYSEPFTMEKLVSMSAVQVAAGYDHSVALTEDGSVWTWGANHAGQLGLGLEDTPILRTPTPNDTYLLRTETYIRNISAGKTYTSMSDMEGQVYGAGDYNHADSDRALDQNDTLGDTPIIVGEKGQPACGGGPGRRAGQGRVYAQPALQPL